jgi:hypothetical protein
MLEAASFFFSAHNFEKYLDVKSYEDPPVGVELFHVHGRMDGQTDMTELTSLLAILRTRL